MAHNRFFDHLILGITSAAFAPKYFRAVINRVARFEVFDIRPGGFHHSGRIITEDSGRLHSGPLPRLADFIIYWIEGNGINLYQELVGMGRWFGYFGFLEDF